MPWAQSDVRFTASWIEDSSSSYTSQDKLGLVNHDLESVLSNLHQLSTWQSAQVLHACSLLQMTIGCTELGIKAVMNDNCAESSAILIDKMWLLPKRLGRDSSAMIYFSDTVLGGEMLREVMLVKSLYSLGRETFELM